MNNVLDLRTPNLDLLFNRLDDLFMVVLSLICIGLGLLVGLKYPQKIQPLFHNMHHHYLVKKNEEKEEKEDVTDSFYKSLEVEKEKEEEEKED